MKLPEISVPLLSIEQLSVEFSTRGGTIHALKGVSFAVHKGEMVGVVGESGSGKSVTAFSAMGILDRAGRVVGGRAVFGGLDLVGAAERTLREMRGRELSMIFQNPRVALNPIRRVGAQIEDVLREHSTTPRVQLRAKAIEALHQVRIAEPEQRYWAYPFELSGGMCQRVMIAIALACRPSLLIADEPTTGLDVTTQKTIMDLLQELARERHMATILITHDLGVASRYCERIVVMRAGEVVEAAPTRQLFNDPQHPYTRKLIAATPRKDSRLADLRQVAPEGDGVLPTRLPEATPVAVEPAEPGTPLLELVDLVKEYPLGSGSWTVKEHLRAAWGRLRGHVATAEPPVFRAVDGVSFKVMVGESVGLVGESGCGKSTTSSMISRLLDPTSGAILFEGRDLSAWPAARFARRPERALIQMVFQDPTESLNPRFTALECIADPIRRLGTRVDRARLRERVAELADRVGLPAHLLTRFPHQLSGGQKARVGIARAIALRPRLLILDEPTSALDVSVQAVVLNLLDQLRSALGMSYIFVSHDLNVVRLLCSRVIVMHRGRIVEEGQSAELLENPKNSYTRALVAAIPHFETEPAPPPSWPPTGVKPAAPAATPAARRGSG